MSRRPPQMYHNKGVTGSQPHHQPRSPDDQGSFLLPSGGPWIHRDVLLAITEAFCAILFIGHPFAEAIRLTIALNIFLWVSCDVAPRFHHHPLFHFFSGLSAGYMALSTQTLWQLHLFGKMF